MHKTLLGLIVAAFGALAFNAQAASHAGGAPMKAASAPANKEAAKKNEKKSEKKKTGEKAAEKTTEKK